VISNKSLPRITILVDGIPEPAGKILKFLAEDFR
jgi:hypothetical protein